MEQTDPDVALMLAVQKGDDRAFEKLFRRWAGPLERFLERMVGDQATAEELLQETFIRVHRARDGYEPRARFSTWLYRIATNLALNEIKRPRRRHFHEETNDALLPDRGPAADELVDARLIGAEVERELGRLPERQRAALWLSAAEGHSYGEVALMLETTEKSVKALVHRGRVTLVERLGKLRNPASPLRKRAAQ